MTFFDLRTPLGWLFVIIGSLLVVNGFRGASNAETNSLGTHINLVWGAVMITFGLVCLWLATRHARKQRSPEQPAPPEAKQ